MDKQILVSADLLRQAAAQIEADALMEYGYVDAGRAALAAALRAAIAKAQ